LVLGAACQEKNINRGSRQAKLTAIKWCGSVSHTIVLRQPYTFRVGSAHPESTIFSYGQSKLKGDKYADKYAIETAKSQAETARKDIYFFDTVYCYYNADSFDGFVC
jgi:hypothetical protein